MEGRRRSYTYNSKRDAEVSVFQQQPAGSSISNTRHHHRNWIHICAWAVYATEMVGEIKIRITECSLVRKEIIIFNKSYSSITRTKKPLDNFWVTRLWGLINLSYWLTDGRQRFPISVSSSKAPPQLRIKREPIIALEIKKKLWEKNQRLILFFFLRPIIG